MKKLLNVNPPLHSPPYVEHCDHELRALDQDVVLGGVPPPPGDGEALGVSVCLQDHLLGGRRRAWGGTGTTLVMGYLLNS